MDLLKGKDNAEKAKSLEVAEEAREESGKLPSFVGDLFMGRVRWELAFPFPEQSEADKAAFNGPFGYSKSSYDDGIRP